MYTELIYDGALIFPTSVPLLCMHYNLSTILDSFKPVLCVVFRHVA